MLGGTMLSGLLALEKEYPCNEKQRLERLNSYWPTCGTAGDGDMCQDHREDCHYCPARQGSRWAHRWEGNCTTKLPLSWFPGCRKELVPKVTAQVVMRVLRHTSSGGLGPGLGTLGHGARIGLSPQICLC